MKRIFPLLLAALILAGLAGCGSPEKSESGSAEDGAMTAEAFGDVLFSTPWGASIEELTKELDGVSCHQQDGGIVVDNAVVCGAAVTLEYEFSYYEDAGESLLCGIYITPGDGSGLSVLRERLTDELGEKETEGQTASGGTYELPESSRFWHSGASVAELGGDGYKQSLTEAGYGQNNSFGLPPEDYADYILGQTYPITVTEETDGNGTRLHIDANWAVLMKLAGFDITTGVN